MKKNKEQSIESLRGLAIILVIIGHVIGSKPNEGLKVMEDSVWGYIYYCLVLIRMPLFTVISGYVYSLYPVIRGTEWKFLKGKARRVLLPMISVGLLHFTMQAIVPGVNRPTDFQNIWRVPFFSYEHFWFLQVIFTIFIVQTLLDSFNLMNNKFKWLIILFLTICGSLFININTSFFSLSRFFYLLPFFVFGCGINRFKLDKDTRYLIISLIFLIPGIIVHQLNWFNIIQINVERNSILGLIVGLSSALFLFSIRKNITILSKLGYFAFGIYLFHVFGLAGSRIVLNLLGINSLILNFIVGTTCGIMVPIIIEFFLEKNNLLKKLFLGLKSTT